jgi:hypothetical protein
MRASKSRCDRRHIRLEQLFALLVMAVLAAGRLALAQANTRLLLANGTGVPGHTGFVFGPFSSLAMNEAKDVVFLTSLRSARIELRAIARSTGVTFSILAFQGLRSPVPRATYDSFSAPSLNNAGDIVFTAQLKDEVPASAVIRVRGGNAIAAVISGDNVPGMPDTTFQEFSGPLVNSAGNILFSARTAGKTASSGLFLWTPRGIQSVAVPAAMNLTPNDLLEPVYFSHDEAVLVRRGTSPEAAVDQFFRAVAIKSFQELNPPPQLSETYELLPARPADLPVKMLIALMEGDSVQTVPLPGEPGQAVMARRQAGIPSKPLGRILGQTAGAQEKLLFAATTAGQESDLGFYCYCEGQAARLTSPEELLPIVQTLRGAPILSLAADSQQTLTFIVPAGPAADSTSIYVTSLP